MARHRTYKLTFHEAQWKKLRTVSDLLGHRGKCPQAEFIQRLIEEIFVCYDLGLQGKKRKNLKSVLQLQDALEAKNGDRPIG